jgi:hypothetical protein
MNDSSERSYRQRRWVNIARIIPDGGTFSRGQIESSIVSQYADLMASDLWDWSRHPPVFFQTETGQIYPGDGHLRIWAVRRAGRNSIYAEIRPGTLDTAIDFSLRNLSPDGWPLTLKDRRYRIEEFLRRLSSKALIWSAKRIALALQMPDKQKVVHNAMVRLGIQRRWHRRDGTQEHLLRAVVGNG